MYRQNLVVNLYNMSDGPEPDVSHIIHLARIEHNIQKKEGQRETGFLFRQADKESFTFHRIISLDSRSGL